MKPEFIWYVIGITAILIVVFCVFLLIKIQVKSWIENMKANKTWLYRFTQGGTWYRVENFPVPWLTHGRYYQNWQREPAQKLILEDVVIYTQKVIRVQKFF